MCTNEIDQNFFNVFITKHVLKQRPAIDICHVFNQYLREFLEISKTKKKTK